MNDSFLTEKRQILEHAWNLVTAGKHSACRCLLASLDPEMRDCEHYHTTWLSSLIFEHRWQETEIYARKLVDRHGAYYLSAWHALVNGLCGQGKFDEARIVVAEAIAHWPTDALLQAIEKKISHTQ